jgi:hypothetical protein
VKKLSVLLSVMFFSLTLFSQNGMKLSFERFEEWSNSMPIKDFILIEVEMSNNVMTSVNVKPSEKTTLMLMVGVPERFNDYLMFKEYTASEVYQIEGYKAVYYYSKTDSFLNVEFAEWNLNSTWMVNKRITKEEIEKLYLESGFSKINIQN